MALMIPCGSLLKKLWFAAACALACAWVLTPAAFGQHTGHPVGGHAGAGGHPVGGRVSAPRAAIPPASHPTFSRPPVVFEQNAGFSQGVGGFEQRTIFIHRPIFVRAPFFWLGRGFYPAWWLNCGPTWVWGFGCGNAYYPEFRIENYVAPPLVIYQSPVYVYYSGDHELVLLFLKDGTAYTVIDYWFVGNQVHFIVLEDGGTKIVEQVIGVDELDLRKTIDVNTRRGFRVVRRDEPLEQYLRDHPDANAPLLEPPAKN